MPSASSSASLRVASWNIHGAVGRDRRCSPERIARIVRSFDADIVALQEVDGRTHLGRRAEAFETMGRLLGGNVVEARLFGKPSREHGNLLWSRVPILRDAVHLLPGGWEQRGAIEVEIAFSPMRTLVVVATHLGLSPWARKRQARAIVDRTRVLNEPAVVVMGDLNEWSAGGAVHRELSAAFPVSRRPPTFPARFATIPLDRLYGSADLEFTLIEPPEEAAFASDHLPLIADIKTRP